MVSGHVDGVAEILARRDFDGMAHFRFRAPKDCAKFIAVKGSVALDGTSLTVNAVEGDDVRGSADPAHARGDDLGRAQGGRPGQYRGRPDGALCRAADREPVRSRPRRYPLSSLGEGLGRGVRATASCCSPPAFCCTGRRAVRIEPPREKAGEAGADQDHQDEARHLHRHDERHIDPGRSSDDRHGVGAARTRPRDRRSADPFLPRDATHRRDRRTSRSGRRSTRSSAANVLPRRARFHA